MAKKKKKRKSLFSKKTLLTDLITKAIKISTWPLAWLPRPVGLAFGDLAGRLAFRLMARRRRIALANIEMIKANGSLPDDLDARATAQKAFANLGQSAWEALCLFHRGFKPFENFYHVEEGREYLEAILADSRQSGRGVVLATAHVGNWELMCHYLPITFHTKLTVIGRDSGNVIIDGLVHDLRQKGGNDFIPKSGGTKGMLQTLRKGGVLGTLIDQAVLGDPGGAMLPFLGRNANTNLGPVRLARKTGAALSMVLFRRQGPHNYMKVFPAIEARTDLEPEEAILADARQLNDWLSRYIQDYPEQWMWGHRRWKTKRGIKRDRESLT